MNNSNTDSANHSRSLTTDLKNIKDKKHALAILDKHKPHFNFVEEYHEHQKKIDEFNRNFKKNILPFKDILQDSNEFLYQYNMIQNAPTRIQNNVNKSEEINSKFKDNLFEQSPLLITDKNALNRFFHASSGYDNHRRNENTEAMKYLQNMNSIINTSHNLEKILRRNKIKLNASLNFKTLQSPTNALNTSNDKGPKKKFSKKNAFKSYSMKKFEKPKSEIDPHKDRNEYSQSNFNNSSTINNSSKDYVCTTESPTTRVLTLEQQQLKDYNTKMKGLINELKEEQKKDKPIHPTAVSYSNIRIPKVPISDSPKIKNKPYILRKNSKENFKKCFGNFDEMYKYSQKIHRKEIGGNSNLFKNFVFSDLGGGEKNRITRELNGLLKDESLNQFRNIYYFTLETKNRINKFEKEQQKRLRDFYPWYNKLSEDPLKYKSANNEINTIDQEMVWNINDFNKN